MKNSITKKLDLDNYIEKFQSFLAREKSIIMEGDAQQHYRYIAALSTQQFPEPKPLPDLQLQLNRLRKQATLTLDEIYAFVTIVMYFNRLKALEFPEPLYSWIHGIDIPDEVAEIPGYFTDEGGINPEREPELKDIDKALLTNKRAIKDVLYRLAHSSKLKDYLVDTQIHLQNGEETLLVRGGFNQILKASVVGRSDGGFFYILPRQISELKERESELLSRREDIIWQYCQRFSTLFHTWERFLRYIDKEYDRFDHYQARVSFARAYEYDFVLPSANKRIQLSEFAHPAIENPIPVTITLDKPIMLITGVNAGGKTMLLKSILSAAYMSKYLLPFRCNATQTEIGSYRSIEAIIDDPQSVKNDISTFAGRMVEFSKLFSHRGSIVGVDEIELGTDADEAAALFKVMLEQLADRDIMFVVTTHHKRLASLMATNSDVDLVAALYDEKKRLPTYTFLQGSIGKSYAFETAERYGIDPGVVEKAKEFYGEDKEKLNELIEKSTTLEREMRQKIDDIDLQREKIEKRKQQLEDLEEQMRDEQRKTLATLENRYNAATKCAQQALKTTDISDGRRLLNEAHKHKEKAKTKKETKPITLTVGDRVKYRSHRGDLVALKGKEATILVDGLRMRVPATDLKCSPETNSIKKAKKPTGSVSVSKGNASVTIKLLGMRGEEAIERVDKFLSDALLNGLGEVEIIHGTGGGVLARLVTEYLEQHPRVKKFYRVAGNLGATIVEL